MRRLTPAIAAFALLAGCGDGGPLRPYPAPPVSSPPQRPEDTSTTTTIDPRVTARAQAVVLVAADMPGFEDTPPTTTTVTTAPGAGASPSSTGPARRTEDVDFGACKAAAVQRLLKNSAAVTGPTLKRGTGEESAEITSVAVFGSQPDATAALDEVGSAEVANCIATQLAGQAATAKVSVPRVAGVDEAQHLEMTVPRPTVGGASREVRFVFIFLRKGDGLAAAVYKAPTTVIRTADQTRMTTTLGTKLVKAAATPTSSPSTSSSSPTSSSSSSSSTRP